MPRRRTPEQIAALGAAVLIALQLAVTHWFYLYVVWFAPFVLVAVFAAHFGRVGPAPPDVKPRAPAVDRARPPVPA